MFVLIGSEFLDKGMCYGKYPPFSVHYGSYFMNSGSTNLWIDCV